jgi:tol-pal system protein YbgF
MSRPPRHHFFLKLLTMILFPKAALGTVLLATFSYFPLHASAGLLDDEEARKAILDLRAKVDVVVVNMNTRLDSKSDKTNMLDMYGQQEHGVQETAKLRGSIEVLSNDLTNIQKRQKDFYNDLDIRLRRIEQRQLTTDSKEAESRQLEQSAYDAALQMFKSGDYKAAVFALEAFLKGYPHSSSAANAQYWLGNTYYAQHECTSAIAAQKIVFKNYPDSPRASDALLNIASCYTELKDKTNARKTLETLVASYPSSNNAQVAKDRLLKK